MKEQIRRELPDWLVDDPRFARLVSDIVEKRLTLWQAEARELRQGLAQLLEAHQQAEKRWDRIEQSLQALTEAQARTEERVNQLAEAQAHTEERLDRVEQALERLAEAQAETEKKLQRLTESHEHLIDVVGEIKGRVLETIYRDHCPAYFGRWLRRPQAVSVNQLWDEIEEALSEDELNDILRLDLVVRGSLRDRPDEGDMWKYRRSSIGEMWNGPPGGPST